MKIERDDPYVHVDERNGITTEIGTARELYDAIKDETVEYMANNDEPCMYDVIGNANILLQLEEIIHCDKTLVTDDALFCVEWNYKNEPTLYSIACSEWEGCK